MDWAEQLAGWAVPPEILAAAPQTPYFFDRRTFSQAAEVAVARADDSPSDARARQALPGGGEVLDVGVGGGAASLRLGAWRIIGVDSEAVMLETFEAAARDAGIESVAVCGRWPDVAAATPDADVVVCHHVFYNVADLVPFSLALDSHARRRVVVELTGRHPLTWMAPYWRELHGWEPPDGPTADDAVAVLEGGGLRVGVERWEKPITMFPTEPAQRLATVGRRLCLPEARLGELQALLEEIPPPEEREVVTLWWDR